MPPSPGSWPPSTAMPWTPRSRLPGRTRPHRRRHHRHLLSAVTHAPTVTLAQREVGAKTNETAAFRPLLEPLDLTGTVVTFDALHSVKDQVRWLVQEKKAHYIAVIKGNQPTASA
ncbi:transposase [Streptomyces sp. NPDC093261]|uniref:transposase n=1 Tax=Streptomyces sp. NPDC093261 TaxID=3366037 RepID=UPI003809EC9B